MARDFEFNENGWLELQQLTNVRIMAPTAAAVRDDAIRYAPYNHDPRAKLHTHLKDSIRAERVDWDHWQIGSPLDYAAAVEMGSRPHLIPHAFGRPGAVHHPGHPAPQPYLRRALYQPRTLG